MSFLYDPRLDKIDAEWTTATPEQAAAEIKRLRRENAAMMRRHAQLVRLASQVCGLAGGAGQDDAITELGRFINYPGY